MANRDTTTPLSFDPSTSFDMRLEGNETLSTGTTIAAIEPRIVKLEEKMSSLLLSVDCLKSSFESFRDDTNESLLQIQELLKLIVMSRRKNSSEKKKINHVEDAYVIAQQNSADSLLTIDIQNKSGTFVLPKCAVDFVKRKSFGIQTVHCAMQFLNFASHPSVRKQAAESEMGIEFHRMKMYLVQNYVSNCIESAKQQEREQSTSNILEAGPGVINNGSEDVASSLQNPFFRPKWTSKGTMSKSVVLTECEKLAGVRLSRRRAAPTDTRNRKNNNSASDSVARERNVDGSSPANKRQRVRKEVSENQVVAKAVVGVLWTSATKWLNQARHNGRRSGTRSYGFIITPRAKAKWNISYDTSYYARLRDIGDAWMPVLGRTPEQCKEANQNMVKELMVMFPKLEFEAQYDVCVMNDGDIGEEAFHGEDEDVKTLRVTVNIIMEALKYLTNYFHHKEPYQFMRLSKDSCRLIFMVAMSIASSLEEFKRMMSTGTHISELEKFLANAGLLVEGEGTRNTIINQVLSKTRAEYEQLNESVRGNVDCDRSNAMSVDSENEGDSSDEFDEVVLNL